MDSYRVAVKDFNPHRLIPINRLCNDIELTHVMLIHFTGQRGVAPFWFICFLFVVLRFPFRCGFILSCFFAS